jgi:tetratricopeptide (TPR) repeat protein
MKRMRKNTVLLLAIFAVLTLSACAVPEKIRVRQPPPAPPAVVTITPPQPRQEVPAVPVPEPVVVVETRDNSDAAMADTSYLSDRIFAYGSKLDRWKELDDRSVTVQLSAEEAAEMVRCFRQLQQVLNGYTELRGRVLQGSGRGTGSAWQERFAELQRQDVDFLEDRCGQLLSASQAEAVAPALAGAETDLGGVEGALDQHSAAGEYEQVVQLWTEVPAEQKERLQLRSKLHAANALMLLHQEGAAAEIYQQVVEQMSASSEQATDLVSLRKVLADLYTASGRYPAAALQYQQILEDYQNLGRVEEWAKLHLSILERAGDAGEELRDYGSILGNYLGFVVARDGFTLAWQSEKFLARYPYSAVAANVEMIREQSQTAASGWFGGQLAKVDALTGDKRYGEALELLQGIPMDIVGPEQEVVVREKNESILLAEAVARETEKMALLQDLQNRWNNGMLLAKAMRYDEAIGVFSELLESEYAERAAAKIKELSLEAAKEERKKAADIFIRYTKTTDLESRKKLLLETHRVLQGILVKYPEVEIAAKVVENIKRVEEEINLVDPGLLRSIETPALPLDGVDQVFAPPLPR